MSALISCAADLAPFIPNYVLPAFGDRDIFDKIMPYIDTAEEWTEQKVCPVNLYPADARIRAFLRQIVAFHAMSAALAMLDVVITPNGIGVVSTDTIAPASKERTAEGRRSLIAQRDHVIFLAIEYLRCRGSWLETEPAGWWGSILYHEGLGIPEGSASFNLSHFEGIWYDRHAKETALAIEAVGDDLMDHLRAVNLRCDANADERRLIDKIRNLCRLERPTTPGWREGMADIVDFIRSNPAEFPQWPGSKAAARWSGPRFENKRDSTGFFF